MGSIGFFGGTFDPPHMGHILAAQAFWGIGLDELYIIPTNIPPLKNNSSAPPEHRLAMCKLCFEGVVWDVELRSGGVSYTYLTVEKLKALHPNDRLLMLIGSDQLFKLEKWRKIDYLREEVTFVVAPRYANREADYTEISRLSALGYDIIALDIPHLEISSTQIRECLKTGKTTGFLHENVVKYIEEHHLYEDF